MKTLEELYEKFKDNIDVKDAYLKAVAENKVNEFLKEHDCDATEAALKDFLNSKDEKTGELNDDELDSVAGGGNCGTIYHNNRPVVVALNRCDLWICENHQVPFNQEPRYHCDPDCGACYYSHYEDGLLICYHPNRVDN